MFTKCPVNKYIIVLTLKQIPVLRNASKRKAQIIVQSIAGAKAKEVIFIAETNIKGVMM